MELSNRRTRRRFLFGLAMAITILAGIFSGRLLIDRGVGGSEDNILFYMMGLNLVAAEKLETMASGAIDYYTTRIDDPHVFTRLNLRKTYLNEFVLPGAIYMAVSRTFKGMFDINRSYYPLFLSQAVVFGLTAAMVLSVICVTFLVRTTKRPLHLWALALTVLLFSLSEYLPIKGNAFATILANDKFGDVLAHLGHLLVRPGPQFSPIGFTPRAHFSLLMIAIFALRWSNRHDMGYLLLIGLSFVHLSTSALILFALLAVDIFLRPSMFKKPQTAALILLAAILILSRQTMWKLMGENGPVILAGAGVFALLIGVGLFLPVIRRSITMVYSKFAPVRNWLMGSNKIAADLRVLIIGWIITFLALFAIITVFEPFDPLSRFYFWGRLHGRVATILWPSVVFGLFVQCGLRLMRQENRRRKSPNKMAIAGILLLLISAYPGAKSMMDGQVLKRVAIDFSKLDQRLYGNPMTTLPPMGFEEKVLYYGMSKSVDLNEDYLQLILR
jgi:hypothetical protein